MGRPPSCPQSPISHLEPVAQSRSQGMSKLFERSTPYQFTSHLTTMHITALHRHGPRLRLHHHRTNNPLPLHLQLRHLAALPQRRPRPAPPRPHLLPRFNLPNQRPPRALHRQMHRHPRQRQRPRLGRRHPRFPRRCRRDVEGYAEREPGVEEGDAGGYGKGEGEVSATA